jgi:hypothetical protein
MIGHLLINTLIAKRSGFAFRSARKRRAPRRFPPLQVHPSLAQQVATMFFPHFVGDTCFYDGS